MERGSIAPRTRCVLCISCANAYAPEDRGPGGCAAGATPPSWTGACEHFVHDWRPLRFLDRRRGGRRDTDRRQGGR